VRKLQVHTYYIFMIHYRNNCWKMWFYIILENHELNDANKSLELNLSQLSIVDYFVFDSSPLDINLTDFCNLNIPPVVWLETDTTPIEMTVQNTGKMCNKIILL